MTPKFVLPLAMLACALLAGEAVATDIIGQDAVTVGTPLSRPLRRWDPGPTVVPPPAPAVAPIAAPFAPPRIAPRIAPPTAPPPIFFALSFAGDSPSR